MKALHSHGHGRTLTLLLPQDCLNSLCRVSSSRVSGQTGKHGASLAWLDGQLMAHACQGSRCLTCLQAAGKGGAAAKKKSSSSGQENVEVAQREICGACALDRCLKCFMAVLQVLAPSKHIAATGKAAGKWMSGPASGINDIKHAFLTMANATRQQSALLPFSTFVQLVHRWQEKD